MKEKIMYLIIGVLIGAIVTTSGFLIYNKTTKNTKINERNMSNMGEPQARPDGDNSEMWGPPSIDNSDNSNMSELPTKPDGSKSQAPSGSNQRGGNRMNDRNTKNFH